MSATPPPVIESAPASTEQQDQFSWWNVWLFLAQRGFLYFVLYALSIGPIYWSWYKSRFVSGSNILAAFYIPLIWLADSVPAFGEWMNWYIRLWTG